MRVAQQLSMLLDNRPGSLAAACRDLAEHGVNIEAISIANLVDHAVVRMVVDDPRTAVHVLGEAGTLVITSEVLGVELRDVPGAIAELARVLGRAHVNIDYMYGSSRPNRDGRSILYIRVSDPKAAARALTRRRTVKASRRPAPRR